MEKFGKKMDNVNNYSYKSYQNINNTIKNLVKNVIYFMITPYLLLKHFTIKKNPSLLQNITLILLSTILLFLYIFIIFILGAYRKVSEIYLKYKYGERFLQFVVGHDAIIGFHDHTSGIVNVVINIESSKTPDELFENIKERVNDYFFVNTVNKKYFSVREVHLGHMCLMHVNNVTIDDVLSKISDKPQDFDELLYTNGKLPFPKAGSFNWDILFYSHPYEVTKDGKYIYVLQMRMDHLLADGIVMYNIFTNLLSDSIDLKNKYSKSFEVKENSQPFHIKTHLKNADCFVSKPDNILYSGLTSLEVTSCLFVEKTGEYFNKIKLIKSKFEGISFFGILMTAYSAGLSEYFIRNKSEETDTPENICLVTPIQVNKKRISQNYCSKNYNDLENDFSVCPFYIPIVPKDKKDVPLEDYMMERLLLIKKEFDQIADSSDAIVFYILLKTILNVLPHCIGEKIVPPQMTGIVSTIPGGPRITIFNNDILYNVNFFLPKIPQYGIALYVITYDDRLSFTLVGDKEKFSSKKEIQLIAENTLKYLDVLYENVK